MKSPSETSLQELLNEAEELIRRSAPAGADESVIKESARVLQSLVMRSYIVGEARKGTKGETEDMIAALKLVMSDGQANTSSAQKD